MTETKWISWAVLVLFLVIVAASAGYHFGATAGEGMPMAPTNCALCGDPLGEHAVTVLPNETTPFTGSIAVCAKCYRRAVGADNPGEAP